MDKYRLSSFLSVILLFLANTAVFAADSIGQMVWVKGTVKAAQPNEAARTLVRKSPIYASDTITTNTNSTGQIVFSDNSLLALRTDTVLEIAKYKYNKAPLNKNNSFVADVAKGGFRTITGAIAKDSPSAYQANTPVATIGVSGTDFSIYYDPITKRLDSMIQKGAILVKNAQGSERLTADCDPEKDAFCYRIATVRHNEAPKTSKEIPDSLKVVEIITPATFDPNATPDGTKTSSSSTNNGGETTGGSSGTGSGGSGGSSSIGSSGGTVSGFSINQPCP